MPVSPTYALAHVFLPNLTKLQGPNTLISAVERNNKAFFDQVWAQAYVQHDPNMLFLHLAPYRVAVIELPAPRDLGDAHMVAVITRTTDGWFSKYLTLEQDYVLATRTFRTQLCEREGATHRKLGAGPVLTGDFRKDATAFADAALLPIISARGASAAG
jgi:hypothetical protein